MNRSRPVGKTGLALDTLRTLLKQTPMFLVSPLCPQVFQGTLGSDRRSPKVQESWKANWNSLRTLATDDACTIQLARCSATSERVVIKLYPKETLNVKQRARIAREVEIMLTLSGGHSCINNLYGVFEDDEGVKLVMAPYKTDLEDFLEDINSSKEVALTEPFLVKNVVKPLISALAHISYEHKLIHRDLRIKNVQVQGVAKDFKVLLSDFSQSVPANKASSAVGVPYYMAPEILQLAITQEFIEGGLPGNDMYDERIMTWQLGLLVYEMICGRRPAWNGADLRELYQTMSVYEISTDVRATRKMSPEAVDFLSCCLQFERERRPVVAMLIEHPWVAACMAEAEGATGAKPKLDRVLSRRPGSLTAQNMEQFDRMAQVQSRSRAGSLMWGNDAMSVMSRQTSRSQRNMSELVAASFQGMGGAMGGMASRGTSRANMADLVAASMGGRPGSRSASRSNMADSVAASMQMGGMMSPTPMMNPMMMNPMMNPMMVQQQMQMQAMQQQLIAQNMQLQMQLASQSRNNSQRNMSVTGRKTPGAGADEPTPSPGNQSLTRQQKAAMLTGRSKSLRFSKTNMVQSMEYEVDDERHASGVEPSPNSALLRPQRPKSSRQLSIKSSFVNDEHFESLLDDTLHTVHELEAPFQKKGFGLVSHEAETCYDAKSRASGRSRMSRLPTHSDEDEESDNETGTSVSASTAARNATSAMNKRALKSLPITVAADAEDETNADATSHSDPERSQPKKSQSQLGMKLGAKEDAAAGTTSSKSTPEAEKPVQMTTQKMTTQVVAQTATNAPEPAPKRGGFCFCFGGSAAKYEV